MRAKALRLVSAAARAGAGTEQALRCELRRPRLEVTPEGPVSLPVVPVHRAGECTEHPSTPRPIARAAPEWFTPGSSDRSGVVRTRLWTNRWTGHETPKARESLLRNRVVSRACEELAGGPGPPLEPNSSMNSVPSPRIAGVLPLPLTPDLCPMRSATSRRSGTRSQAISIVRSGQTATSWKGESAAFVQSVDTIQGMLLVGNTLLHEIVNGRVFPHLDCAIAPKS